MLKIKRLFSAILVVIILLVSDAAIIASALNTENSQFEDTVKPAESIEPIDDEYCCNGCLVEDVDDIGADAGVYYNHSWITGETKIVSGVDNIIGYSIGRYALGGASISAGFNYDYVLN